MSVTSNDRKRLITELTIFKQQAEEIKERFYKFIVANSPKGYAYYEISASPQGWPFPCDDFVLDLSEPSSLRFDVPGSDNEFPAYMYIPDEYLDDPDGWEKGVLEGINYDKALAQAALESLFGWATATTIGFTVERPFGFGSRDYITVNIDNASLTDAGWELFKTLTRLNRAQISVSRSNGAIYEGGVPVNDGVPENAGTFMKFIRP